LIFNRKFVIIRFLKILFSTIINIVYNIDVVKMTQMKRQLILIAMGILLMGIAIFPIQSIYQQDFYGNQAEANDPSSSLTIHAPITIDGNAALDTFCTLGDGTFGNPYIIENYSIDGLGNEGIDIRNTDKYLEIRNCKVENGTYGIYFNNCTRVNVTNNQVGKSAYGIYLGGSVNNTIFNNSADYNNVYGIYLTGSSNNSIMDNNATNNGWHGIYLKTYSNNNSVNGNTANYCSYEGIYLSKSYNNSISANYLKETGGLLLTYSTGNTLTANLLDNCGFRTTNSSNNSIDTSNKVNGKSLRYYENQTGVFLSSISDVGQVLLVRCNNSLIEYMKFTNCTGGIILENSSHNAISNMKVSNCTQIAISLTNSLNNTISNNIADNSMYGLVITGSSNNSISNNTLHNNALGMGIVFSSTNNTVSNNSAFENHVNGILFMTSSNNTVWNNTFIDNYYSNADSDSESYNIWDNGTHGNYWGDYYSRYPAAINDGSIWNTPYTINHSVSDTDRFPLVLPSPVPPTLLTITPNPDYDGMVHLDWDDISGAISYRIYRSNSPIVGVSALSPIATSPNSEYNNAGLTNGTYYFVVSALNGSGVSAISNCVSVSVVIYLPGKPFLLAIIPVFNTNGTITLDWNDVPGATSYKVYRNVSVLFSTNGLTPIATPTLSTYTDTIAVDGVYCYMVVAVNASGVSVDSNPQSVQVEFPKTSTTSTTTTNTSNSTASNTTSGSDSSGDSSIPGYGLLSFSISIFAGVWIILVWIKKNKTYR
jgi:parallel beta-helix repeat protein